MEIPNQWSFKSEEIAQGFDNHVKAELPWYDLATWSVSTIASHFIPKNGLVYDIGCSTGNIGKAISETLVERNAELIAIDSEESMRNEYSGGGEFVLSDALEYDYKPFDFAVVFLTMMFMPINERSAWLFDLVSKLKSGGAIVVFDKLNPEGGFLSTAMYRMTLEAKLNAGVEPESIIKKELSLTGVQRPLSINELPSSAKEIFRFGDFAGWVMVKS